MESIYDFQKVYEDELKDKVEEIAFICQGRGIPMFTSFAIANSEGKTTYKNEMVSPFIARKDLYDDRIADYIKIAGPGYKAVRTTKSMCGEEVDEFDILSQMDKADDEQEQDEMLNKTKVRVLTKEEIFPEHIPGEEKCYK